LTVIGYIARKTGYHTAAILIGVILGPLLETYFLRALKMSEGNLMVIFSSDLANILWGLLVISLFVPYVLQRRREKVAERGLPSVTDF
jgi:putative tricarboxylic transport membrane protein